MIGVPAPVRILMLQLIPNLSPSICQKLGINSNYRSVGLISTDCDDATYIALDEATKLSNVQVVYAKSLYAGAANASTGFAGEVIGIIAGPTPAEVTSGLLGAKAVLESGIGFRAVGTSAYLAHCVSRTGTYLSKQAGIPAGQSLAYLVAPPVEAIIGLDAALKSSDVELSMFFEPPTETNFAGGLLTGSQSACQAACEAFAEAVEQCLQKPIEPGGERSWSYQKT